MKFEVGDRVKTNLEHAWVYHGTEKQDLMGKERFGVVVWVPSSTRDAGRGSLLIKWESLTRTPLKRSEFWTHSDLIERCGA